MRTPGLVTPRVQRRSQAGAATLVVVMVLFFVMAMVAAYANRNLVFEQRIAGNYYRSGVAFETAEAGAEWTLAMLNGSRIDASCVPDAAGADSLRQRYLSIGADRSITPLLDVSSPKAEKPPLSFGCVRSDASGWVCACPGSGALVPPAVAASKRLQPMFSVVFQPISRPGVLRLGIAGCTDLSTVCESGAAVTTAQGIGQANLIVEAALVSAMKMPPATPLTVHGNTELGSTGLGLHNADSAGGALLLRGGGSLSGNTGRSDSVPGTPVEQALLSMDRSLADASAEQMFAMFFGMSAAQYRDQPSVRRIACESDCSAQLLAAYARGVRQIWIDGPLTIRSNITLGSVTDPLLIISDGPLQLDGPMLLGGVLYARGDASWSNTSAQPAVLSGALLSQGNLSATGSADIVYHPGVINEVNNRMGSFVRVPGSWADRK